MATTPATDVGFNILSFQEMTAYDPNAVLYVVLNEQDAHVRLELLVQYLKDGLSDAQIPEDVVRSEQMAQAIEAAIQGIQLPTVPDLEITNVNLSEKVMAIEAIQELEQVLEGIVQTLSDLSVPSLEGYAKIGEGVVKHRGLVLNEANQLVNSNFGTSHVLYVVGRRNLAEDVFMDGSLEAPFNTIQQGINKSKGFSNGVVIVMPSESGDYAGFEVDGHVNTTVTGYGLTDAHNVKIVGKVVNKGATGTRFRMKNFQVKQASAGVPAYSSEGTQGRDYFKNVTFEPFASNQQEPIVVLGDVSNWIDFEDCNIGGGVEIVGEAGAGALVAMRGGNSTATHVKLHSEVKLLVNSCTRFGSVTQTAGKVEINFTHTFTGKDGIALNSTGGTAVVNFSNLQKADGTYNKIKRSPELSPVAIANSNVSPSSNEGPMSYQGTEQVERIGDPVFTLGLGAVTGTDRIASVIRVATKGYFYESLQGKIVQVASGESWIGSENVTPFELNYGDKLKDVTYPIGAGLGDIYLVLTDTENQDRTFAFGPFPN